MPKSDDSALASTAQAERSHAEGKARSDDLEAQVAQLQADIRGITQTIAKLGEAKMGEATAMAKARAHDLADRGQAALHSAHDEFDAVEKQLKDTIREKPLTAVAGAVALGFLLAVLTR